MRVEIERCQVIDSSVHDNPVATIVRRNRRGWIASDHVETSTGARSTDARPAILQKPYQADGIGFVVQCPNEENLEAVAGRRRQRQRQHSDRVGHDVNDGSSPCTEAG